LRLAIKLDSYFNKQLYHAGPDLSPKIPHPKCVCKCWQELDDGRPRHNAVVLKRWWWQDSLRSDAVISAVSGAAVVSIYKVVFGGAGTTSQ